MLVHGRVGQYEMSAMSPDPQLGMSPPLELCLGGLELGQQLLDVNSASQEGF